ncbi:DUF3185 family protein [Aliidiomarina celeris]|uniref:DUF3185 family protein n=1 Tax=Aliidiomarina celeris TaxID=2249428 RepID=UPI000DE89981|nr:DUF3185 family protein [Aliidiomarina celeris]
MNKIISLALLAAGVILLYFGYQEKQSVGSQVSEAITNQPTDNAIWFIIAGVVAVIIGAGGLFFAGRK